MALTQGALAPGAPINEREYQLLRVNEILGIFAQLVNSYRLLIGGAEEFNRITPAHRSDVDDAVARADDVGDLIDDSIHILDNELTYLFRLYRDETYIPPISPYFSPSHGIFPQLELDVTSDVGEEVGLIIGEGGGTGVVVPELATSPQAPAGVGAPNQAEVETAFVGGVQETQPDLGTPIIELNPDLFG